MRRCAVAPFVLKLSREDGSQRIGGVDAILPPGLSGKLAGAGPAPLHIKSHAYLAGPYKGAPLSLAITPAVAGSFDLGAVLVRTALYVDPASAQVHAVSDPIPSSSRASRSTCARSS